jgi:hypothetical protein
MVDLPALLHKERAARIFFSEVFVDMPNEAVRQDHVGGGVKEEQRDGLDAHRAPPAIIDGHAEVQFTSS